MVRLARLVFAAATCAVALAAAPAAYAQKITGDITGTVNDSTGGALPGAGVTALCEGTGLSRSAVSDPAGGYRLAELPVCVYKVSVTMQGFKTTSRSVQVAVNALSKADFRLEVGSQSEQVTVEAVAPLVEFSDKLNSNVDKERIDNLPLSGRDFNSLLGITPGVQRAPGGGFLAVSINGARTTSNNYMVDGISNNDRYYGDSLLNQTGVVGVPATLVPMDAIAEFTVQQTPSAEFGTKGGAAINVVMRGGTNEFHGSAHYYRHDEWTDSKNFFVERQGGAKTPVNNQQFGATFGGPLVKDKTFFFGYYEGQRLAVTTPFDTPVPTPDQVAEARARIARSGLRTSAGGEALFAFYPTDPSGTVTVPALNEANMHTFAIKLDHRLSQNNTLSGRYFFGTSDQSAPAFVGTLNPAGNNPPDMFNSVAKPSRVHLAGFIWNSTLGPSTILETRFGYSSFGQTLGINNDVDPKSLGIDTGPLDRRDFGVPAIYYFSYFGYIGGVAGYPITTDPDATIDVSSSLTLNKGRHTLKVGGNFQRGTSFSVRNRARTTFNISGGTGDPVDSIVALLLGRFDDASRSFGSTERHLFQNSFALFVNDDWKISPRLTLSAGLRWDVYQPLDETDNIQSNFFPDRGLVKVDRLYKNDFDNFGPRLGFAWDVTGDGRTAVRAGYALTYDVPDFGTIHAPRTTFSGLGARSGAFTNPNLGLFSKTLAGDLGAAPDDPDATCVDPVTGEGNFVCVLSGRPIFGSNPTGDGPFNAFATREDLQVPEYHFFHVSLQRELFKNNVLSLSYVGHRGRKQIMYRDINAPPLGSAGGQANRPFARQYPDLAHIIEVTNDGRSRYNSLQASFRQKWKTINTQYNYTLAKCNDYNSSNRTQRHNFGQAQNPWRPESGEGPCDNDVRHNLNVGGTYGVPDFGLGQLGKGWEFATVLTALSGRPFTPNISSRDRTGQGVGSIRADCLAPMQYSTRRAMLDTPADESVFWITNAAAAFGDPAPGRLGTCGRNSGRLPDFRQWDVSLLKNTKVSDRVTLQLRWEIFNVLNRVNFGSLFSTNVRSGSFGTIASTPDVDAVNPVISQGGPRAMQWAVKLIF
jgi:hypothetical protein